MSKHFVYVSRIVVLDAEGYMEQHEGSPTVGAIQSNSLENIMAICNDIWEAGERAASDGSLKGFRYAMNPVRVSSTTAKEFSAKLGTVEGDNILIGGIV